jgi:hypothetical protein
MCVLTPLWATREVLSSHRHKLGPEGIVHSRAHAERTLAMPVLAFGAENGGGPDLTNAMHLVATDVRGGVFARCGHYFRKKRRALSPSTSLGSWAREEAACVDCATWSERSRRSAAESAFAV